MTALRRAAAPVTTPAFGLRSAPFCAEAQMAKVALAACGTPWAQEAAAEGTRARLTVRPAGAASRSVAGAAAMLDLIEALHRGGRLLPADPGQRREAWALVRLACDLPRRLSAVTRATESNEHDIAVHRLRQGLRRAEAAPHPTDGAGTLGLADAALAPTLFRLRVLDAHHGTFLVDGLPRLSAWGKRLWEHPAVVVALGADAEATYLDLLARRGAVLIAVADAAAWHPLLGHSRPLHGAG